jgi:hypothetical protein
MTTYRVRIRRRHGLLTGWLALSWKLCWWVLLACWWLVVATVWCCWMGCWWLAETLSSWMAGRSRSSGAHSSLAAAAERRSASDSAAQEQTMQAAPTSQAPTSQESVPTGEPVRQ